MKYDFLVILLVAKCLGQYRDDCISSGEKRMDCSSRIFHSFQPVRVPPGVETLLLTLERGFRISSSPRTYWSQFRNIKTLEITSDGRHKWEPCDKDLFNVLLDDDTLKHHVVSLIFRNVKRICAVPPVLKKYHRLATIEFIETGLDTASFYQLTSLKNLTLKSNGMKYLDAGGLSDLPQLHSLNIEDEPKLNFRDKFLSGVSHSLRYLTIKNCPQFGDQQLNNFGVIRHLQVLHLVNNTGLKFTNVGPLLDHFPELQELDLSNNTEITHLNQDTFRDMRPLRRLILDKSGLTEFNIVLLYETPRLELVSLKNTPKIESVKYDPQKSRREMPNNTRVDLSYSNVARLENNVASWVQCNGAGVDLSYTHEIQCSDRNNLRWMSLFYQKQKQSGFRESVRVSSATCADNGTSLAEVLRRINIAGVKEVTCQGCKISSYFVVVVSFMVGMKVNGFLKM